MAERGGAASEYRLYFCDDLTNQSISAYGHQLNLLQTPNIDRLAKEGMLFSDVWSPIRYVAPAEP
jgi:arylsulfatase A-like enzyme